MRFGDVKVGCLFECANKVYAKIEKIPYGSRVLMAVCLTGDYPGSMWRFEDDDEVIPVTWNITKEASDEVR